MTSPTASSTGALYCSYIHIEASNLLRANLIIFPFGQLMVADELYATGLPRRSYVGTFFKGRPAWLEDPKGGIAAVVAGTTTASSVGWLGSLVSGGVIGGGARSVLG